MSTSVPPQSNQLAATPTMGRILMISLSVLALGLAIASMGFFIVQY